jgi:hypothetical protein
MCVVVRVYLKEVLPLFWNSRFFKDRRDRTGWLASSAVDALVRINIQLLCGLEPFFAGCRMNTIDRTDIHARSIFHPDAGLGDNIGHRFLLLFLLIE